MSLVTRCPACATAFKVVRDQLRISEGWVRCGRCGEVFDAALDLQEAVSAPPVAAEPVPESAPAPAWPSASWLDVRAETPPAPAPAPTPVIDEAQPLLRVSDNTPERLPRLEPSLVDDSVDAQLRRVLRRERAPALHEESLVEPRLYSPVPPVPPSDAPATEPALDDALPERLLLSSHEPALQASFALPPPAPPPLPSFMEAPAAPAWAHRRPMTLWWVLAAVAALVLLLQGVRHERDSLAASQPSLRPVLMALCGISRCTLSAPRHIDAIRIDVSNFTPDSDGYRLAFTLRNASTTPLLMPAIEPSLLDGNERPVVRRVFQPAEFGAPPVLAARAEQPATLSLVLKAPQDGSVPPVVGYSMLAFYP
jgi:predicted Zn finger-like uncharacterized protein